MPTPLFASPRVMARAVVMRRMSTMPSRAIADQLFTSGPMWKARAVVQQVGPVPTLSPQLGESPFTTGNYSDAQDPLMAGIALNHDSIKRWAPADVDGADGIFLMTPPSPRRVAHMFAYESKHVDGSDGIFLSKAPPRRPRQTILDTVKHVDGSDGIGLMKTPPRRVMDSIKYVSTVVFEPAASFLRAWGAQYRGAQMLH